MATSFDTASLKQTRKTWLITGVAGFIGSNLLQRLLEHGQSVCGLDDFSVGSEASLERVRRGVGEELWKNFRFFKRDIRELTNADPELPAVDFVLHHAAMGSVPLSFADPVVCHEVNVSGFVRVLAWARRQGVKRVVYASSSAVYGNCKTMPVHEEHLEKALSPYAVTKLQNEISAQYSADFFGQQTVGLRYFNVFGPGQAVGSTYAAVIPQWSDDFRAGRPIYINGDGSTTRDFCFVGDVFRANVCGALAPIQGPVVVNIGSGKATTLNDLFETLRTEVLKLGFDASQQSPLYRDFRPGDILHSAADVTRAEEILGFTTEVPLDQGLAETLAWFFAKNGSV